MQVMMLVRLMVICRFDLQGDYGFDPLGLGEQPEDLKWYVQVELVHCRFVMAGVAGILGIDVSCQLVSFPIPAKCICS
jgi:hypothetical protein